LSGVCSWNLFKFRAERVPCRSSDYVVNHEDCVDCYTSSEARDGIFDGESTQVLSKLVYRDTNKNEQIFHLDNHSCRVIKLKELSRTELKKCGYFCFFHQIDTFYENQHTLVCKYTPPGAYGISSYGDEQFASNWDDRVVIIKTDILCVPK